MFNNSIKYLFVISFLLIGWSFHPPVQAQQLTIIHTNDIHGDIVAGEAFWLNNSSPSKVGGFPKFSTYMKQQRQAAADEGRQLLYLDGGDFLSGTPESDLLDGRPLIAGLNATGLDFAVFGNHEIDLGIENLKQRLQELEATVLATNLRYKTEDQLFDHTTDLVVLELDQLKIGLFGLIHDNTPAMALPRLVEDLIFLPEIETARDAVDRLKNKDVDLIIALTHIGLERDRRLARQVDGIDVIAGGHSHHLLFNEEIVNNTIIIQAGGRLRNAGRLDLKFDENQLVDHNWTLETLYATDYPPDPEMQEILQPYLDQVKSFLAESIGQTSGSIKGYANQTSPLGNLITDIMREKINSDFAFMNPMGVLESLPAGPVTRGDLIRSVRYGNHLVELKLTGDQILEIFERTLKYPDRLYQFSGGVLKFDPTRPRGNRTVLLTQNGQQLQSSSTYTVAVSDFVAAQPIFNSPVQRKDYSDYIIWKLLEEYFSEQSTVEPPYSERYLQNQPAQSTVN